MRSGSTIARAQFEKPSPVNSQATKLFYGGPRAPKESQSDIERIAFQFSRVGIRGKDLVARVRNSCVSDRKTVLAVIKRLRRDHKLQ